jgi:hypothetical protein
MSNVASEYIISTICIGNKYEPIKEHWVKRITDKCKNVKEITIIDDTNIKESDIPSYEYAWWDVVRLKHNVGLCLKKKIPVIHIDMDIIIEKDIEEIVNLPYDIIISKEIGGDQSFPKECSQKVGFGVCSGFYVIKKEASKFMIKMLINMRKKVYNSLSDQVNIMNYIVNNNYHVEEEECILNNVIYKNQIIEIDNIKICVLDFDIITRDPIVTKNQFGNHINIDNVGGVYNFINYFYASLEELPLTCRCGKTHLGDNSICNHISMRQ